MTPYTLIEEMPWWLIRINALADMWLGSVMNILGDYGVSPGAIQICSVIATDEGQIWQACGLLAVVV